MKKTILFCGLFIGSLMYAQKTDSPVSGNDRDAHGCIGSAGYTYSQIKKDCVQSFAQKTMLTEQNPKGSYTSQTGVIFSKDMKKAEIFIKDGKENSMILTKRTKKTAWKNGEYILSPVKKGYELKKNNVVIYK